MTRTLNTQHSTLNPQHSTLNIQPSTLNIKNTTAMNNYLKTTMILILACLMIPSQVNAQKRKSQKRRSTTTRLKTYPQRDDAFLRDYKLEPMGAFDLHDYSINYVTLPAPNFHGHVLQRDTRRKQVSLRQLSCRENGITDDDEWFERNGLQQFRYFYDEPRQEIRPRFRFDTGGYAVITYGPYHAEGVRVVVADPSLQTYYKAYNFENFRMPAGIKEPCGIAGVDHVKIEGNIMYVSHQAYTEYKSGSEELTGFVTAIDMRTDEVLWTTEPKTCNSYIEIIGNSIICGYGSSFESDYLYVVDKYSGQRVQKIWLKKASEYIIEKGGKLYVRTYSFDYVFNY